MFIDLLRPRAIASHLLVLTVVVTCVLLGQWQLDRLEQVRANNDRLERRLAADEIDLAPVMSGATVDEEALEFRRVSVTGTYRPEQEVLQRNRSHQAQQGFHLLTPLELRDGGVVLVRRGWVPAELDDPPVTEAAPPSGVVTVTGLLERPVGQPGFGAQDPDEGVLERVFHTDTDRLDRQIDGDLFPMVVRMQTADASTGGGPGDLPRAIGPPTLDEDNHLSYAVQWHIFAVIALAAYVAWWRTRLRTTSTDEVPVPETADAARSHR